MDDGGKSYRSAAELFEQGRIDYDGLRSLVVALPPPDKKPVAESIADIYRIADLPDGDNALIWLECLCDSGLIDLDQLMELINVSVDGKDSIPPS